MNKTVTINISGIIFHIEEDAYSSLSLYLSTIKGYFSTTDGGNEIMSDIEARIAELLQARINATKQVILMNDVEHVINVMGKPEEFGAEQVEDAPKSDFQAEYSDEKIKRRLFRNPDEKAIGGVCSGLAAYFDIDTVWVRLAMFLLIFFGGLSLWVYVILWIVIPQAKTTADKFAMRGESANVNSILRSFKEEANDVKNRFGKYGRQFKDEAVDAKNRFGREFKDQDYGEKVRSGISHALNVIFNIVGRLIGVFLLFLGCVLLFAYLTTLFGISVVDSNTNFSNWKHVLFNSSSDYAWAIIAFILVIGIPVLMFFYGGIKLLFRIHYRNRWLNLGLGFFWITGLAIGVYITATTLQQFTEHAQVKENVELRDMGDTLVIKLNPALGNLKMRKFDNDDDLENYFEHNHGGYYFGDSAKQLSIIGYAGLTVVENTADSLEVIISRASKGGSKREANENARAINYAYHQNGRELVFDEVFHVAPGSKFRAQELEIKIKLPKGKVIYFDKSVKYLLDDIENTTNTWDGDMINRRWIMTDKGLQCIDCKDLEDAEDKHRHRIKTKNVTINDNEIHVHGQETDIKIDEKGIQINTPEKKTEVKNDSKQN